MSANVGERKFTISGTYRMLNIGSFEEVFLQRSYFMGENKLDRVLLSLLRLIDVSPLIEDYQGKTFVLDKVNLEKKIRMHTNHSIRYRYKTEKRDRDFSLFHFCLKYGIQFDRINGIYPLVFDDRKVVFHSLKLAYALYLTLKMFFLDEIKSNQRNRHKRIVPTKGNLLSVIFVNIYSQLKKLQLTEEQIIKCLKTSLCLLVSRAFDQEELPEGKNISLLPQDVHQKIRKNLSETDYVRLMFSMLQSKALCLEVPAEFIQTTLEKHRAQLSSPHRGISQDVLDFFKEQGRLFGEKVKKFYDPHDGFHPSNKATFGFPRDRGGVKGDLVFHQRCRDYSLQEDAHDRMEPYVVGLFGQPGQGKSTRLNELISIFSVFFPHLTMQQLVYQRTCHTEHWDGYCGQPIVIFDDLGQSADAHDIQEFQTLVSCNPYRPPMADLSDKGIMFSSPIIITTSNLHYGVPLNLIYKDSQVIIDDNSFWRRFSKVFYVESSVFYELTFIPTWNRRDRLLFDREASLDRKRSYPCATDLSHVQFRSVSEFDSEGDPKKWRKYDGDFSELVNGYLRKKKTHENYRNTWTQTVVNKCQDTEVLTPLLNDLESRRPTKIYYSFLKKKFEGIEGTHVRKELRFPAFPPAGPLPIRVEPIIEPLKVRTITAGMGDTFCLKPFQHAMWRALGCFPQYCLTHGTNRLESAIDRIYSNSKEGDVWISGDYSAATDSIALEATKAVLAGILETSTDHEPTKRWAMKEVSPHMMYYPKSSGLKPALQRSGQLMGSLLSFPILCIINNCTALLSGLKEDQYLINGDDILMRTTPTTYPKWRKIVEDLGLDLSPGKNYIHPTYGTVNSQLIVDGQVVGSGKQVVLDRRANVLGQCQRDLEFFMPETPTEDVIDLFKSVNRAKLSRTIRNIGVPVSHGGLSFSWDPRPRSEQSEKTARLCYFHDLFSRIEPKKGCISIPYFSIEEKGVSDARAEEMIFNDAVTSREFHEDFLSPVDLTRVARRVNGNQFLRQLMFQQKLETLPALPYLKAFQIPCTDVRVRSELQCQIDKMFFLRFLQGGQDFSYKVFREEFIRTMTNLPSGDNTKKTVTYIVDVMDLQVSSDWLYYLNLNFDPTSFSTEEFVKSIGKELKPKVFDPPEDLEVEPPDYSTEVLQSFLEYERQLIELNSVEGYPLLEEVEKRLSQKDESNSEITEDDLDKESVGSDLFNKFEPNQLSKLMEVKESES